MLSQKTELNKEWEREQPALPRFSFHLPISKDSLDLKQHFTSLDGRAFGDRKGQEGCTLPGKNYMYTHQAADQYHLSEAYCTWLHPYTIVSRRHGASEKHKRCKRLLHHSSVLLRQGRHHPPEVCRTEIICRETWPHYSPLILE